jgi:hypothetical protein
MSSRSSNAAVAHTQAEAGAEAWTQQQRHRDTRIEHQVHRDAAKTTPARRTKGNRSRTPLLSRTTVV